MLVFILPFNSLANAEWAVQKHQRRQIKSNKFCLQVRRFPLKVKINFLPWIQEYILAASLWIDWNIYLICAEKEKPSGDVLLPASTYRKTTDRKTKWKTFFVCGIQDWLQKFSGYDIQIEQTPFGIRKRTNKQLQDAGNDLIFLRDMGSIQPNRGPH